MVFTTWKFFVFFAVVLSLLPRLSLKNQNRLLLVASFFFYGSWDWRFLGLLLVSIVVDYTAGRALEATAEPSRRQAWVLFSVSTNLGILGFFKYWNFFVDSANQALHAAGLGAITAHLDIVLPVGISFYTFQSLGYTIDVYHRRLPAVRRLDDYALFVSYFPQLVAGPIERTSNLLPQLLSPRAVTGSHILSGCWLITWGLFKKVVIADNLAVWVDAVFALPGWDNGLVCLVGLYAFALQIYGDFSGYSDMARGVSRLMGVELMTNFRLPYAADNPAEFWRRWHISLSTWLRDYLFLPASYAISRRLDFTRWLGLGVDRWIYAGAITITMLLAGLWHGAAWTFVVWGLYHGSLLAFYRILPTRRALAARWRGIRVFAMFHLTCAGWLLFRAASLSQAKAFTLALVAAPYRFASAENMIVEVACFALALWSLEVWLGNVDDPRTRAGFTWLGWVVVPLLWLSVLVFEPPAGKSFIYFQF